MIYYAIYHLGQLTVLTWSNVAICTIINLYSLFFS